MNELENLVANGSVTDPASARGRLLTKAAHLFRVKGYERTTVRDLAAEVGIQSGSIFSSLQNQRRYLAGSDGRNGTL